MRLHHLSEVQVDARPLRVPPVPRGKPRTRGEKVGAHTLHVLAGMKAVRFEVRTITRVRAFPASPQVHPVGEARGALDPQQRRGVPRDQKLFAPGRKAPFLERPQAGLRRSRLPSQELRRVLRSLGAFCLIPGPARQALPEHQRRRHHVLAGISPRRAGAAMPEVAVLGPQRDVEVVAPAPHDGCHALRGPGEVVDTRLACVASSVSQCLAPHPREKALQDLRPDHVGGKIPGRPAGEQAPALRPRPTSLPLQPNGPRSRVPGSL